MDDLKIGNGIPSLTPTKQLAPSKKDQGFGDIVNSAVAKVNKFEHEANQSIGDLLQGKADIHETMIALQKSDISLRTFMAVRNKVIEAYREIMRMQF